MIVKPARSRVTGAIQTGATELMAQIMSGYITKVNTYKYPSTRRGRFEWMKGPLDIHFYLSIYIFNALSLPALPEPCHPSLVADAARAEQAGNINSFQQR